MASPSDAESEFTEPPEELDDMLQLAREREIKVGSRGASESTSTSESVAAPRNQVPVRREGKDFGGFRSDFPPTGDGPSSQVPVKKEEEVCPASSDPAASSATQLKKEVPIDVA